MRIYISHSIRGKYGKNATHTQMKENCDAIIEIAERLRRTFPQIDFYVPAEHEDFVLRAYDKHYITETQILDVDCSIIDSCDAMIIYVPEDDELQGGRLVEYNHVFDNNIPRCLFSWLVDAERWISHYIIRS